MTAKIHEGDSAIPDVPTSARKLARTSRGKDGGTSRRSDVATRNVTLRMSVEAARRLSVHAEYLDRWPGEIVSELILLNLKRFKVADMERGRSEILEVEDRQSDAAA